MRCFLFSNPTTTEGVHMEVQSLTITQQKKLDFNSKYMTQNLAYHTCSLRALQCIFTNKDR